MDPQSLLAPDAGVPLGRSRARVLDLLREAAAPMGVQEVAEHTGLHPNTARFHLEALAESGLAIREQRAREAPGRPSMTYRAAGDGPPAGERRYRLLAEMLTSLIRTMIPRPAAAAVEAGREWGAYFTQQPLPGQRPDAGQAAERLAGLLADMGFSADVQPDGARLRMNLHECPFREVAHHHQDVVCALHLGLMQGALTQMRAPVTAERLEPFASPGLCIAHLTAPGQPAQGGSQEAAADPARPGTASPPPPAS